MFGSEILDVVIGMIFVYLLLSLICVQWHLKLLGPRLQMHGGGKSLESSHNPIIKGRWLTFIYSGSMREFCPRIQRGAELTSIASPVVFLV